MKIALFSEGEASKWLNNAMVKLNHEILNISWHDSQQKYEEELKKCDIILFSGGEFKIDIDMFCRIKVPKIYWFNDTAKRHMDVFKEVCDVCDWVFLTQKDDELIDNKNVFWLPAGFDEIYTSTDLSKLNQYDMQEYGCDVSFIGTNNNQRRFNFIEILCEFCQKEDYVFKIWGNNYPGRYFKQNDKMYFYSYIKEWCGPAIYGDKYAKAIALSKINIVIHYPHHGEEMFHLEYGPSFKVMEILGAGGFALVDNVNGLEEFKEKECLATYSSYSDLKEKIKFYLSNKEEMLRIRENARKVIMDGHKWTDRIIWIEKFLKEKCINEK